MKIKFIPLTILFILFFAALALAETSIRAEVDKTNLSTDETLTYKLTIVASEQKIPTPQFPKFEGFNVLSQAQSQNISFVKGQVKTTLVYAFVLTPTDIGKFNIDSSSIKIKNKIYTTDAFKIEVIKGKSNLQPKPKPPLPKKLPSTESGQPQITL